MSEHFQTIVDLQATDEEADQLGALVLAWLVDRGIVEAACRGGPPPGPPDGAGRRQAVSDQARDAFHGRVILVTGLTSLCAAR